MSRTENTNLGDKEKGSVQYPETLLPVQYMLKIHCSHMQGGPKFVKMGTQWGPFPAEMGTQKRILDKLNELVAALTFYVFLSLK